MRCRFESCQGHKAAGQPARVAVESESLALMAIPQPRSGPDACKRMAPREWSGRAFGLAFARRRLRRPRPALVATYRGPGSGCLDMNTTSDHCAGSPRSRRAGGVCQGADPPSLLGIRAHDESRAGSHRRQTMVLRFTLISGPDLASGECNRAWLIRVSVPSRGQRCRWRGR